MGLNIFCIILMTIIDIANTFVLDHFGYRPTMDGTIVSLLTTLMFDVEYTQNMYRLSYMMEQKRFNPSLITEITEHSPNKTKTVLNGIFTQMPMPQNMVTK